MIQQTVDMEMVNSILSDPGIWPHIAPEGMEPFDTPYMPGLIYFLVNETDGVIVFHPFGDGLKIHPNIVPSKRGKLAYIAVEESIQRMFDSGWSSIYCEIPVRFKHVMWFAKALGFKSMNTDDPQLLVRYKLDS